VSFAAEAALPSFAVFASPLARSYEIRELVLRDVRDARLAGVRGPWLRRW